MGEISSEIVLLELENIFYQGDSRYEDAENSRLLTKFLEGGAIIIERKNIDELPLASTEISKMKTPQEYHKLVATKLLAQGGAHV
ncbi:MAG TPA: hypothetical protein VJJ21_03885 [Candidatus Nanoarchaeia archaeon]|nr:hypothetical protein [Candidatus Nanoarchaeia archaeon]